MIVIMLVPGEILVKSAPSGRVRINASIFTSLLSVALVLETVIVYVSVGSSLLLLKRVICTGDPNGRYASDSTVIALPCRGWSVVGIRAGGDIDAIIHPT